MNLKVALHECEDACAGNIKAIRKICKKDPDAAHRASQYLAWQGRQFASASAEIEQRAYRDRWGTK